MTNLPIPSNDLIPNHQHAAIAQAADAVAGRHAFDDYRGRRAFQTLRRQDADLRLFADFLASVRIFVDDLSTHPDGWQSITWGLVQSFVNWQLQQGYAVGSINVHLATVKAYSHLALKAGAITPDAHALIQTVKGYRHAESKHIDDKRETTRIGTKKAEAVVINALTVQALKFNHETTPQGRRDKLLMTLLLDHGLRVGEVTELRVKGFDLGAGMMHFYRPKVNLWSKHKLTTDTLQALTEYQTYGDMPTDADAPLMRASIKSGVLTYEGVTANRLSDRVRVIGKANGIEGLSAHDCRHYWASKAAENGADPFALQEAGGWNSLAMPRWYIKRSEIANAGISVE